MRKSFKLKVKTRSRQSRAERCPDGSYKVWVHEAPEKGRANEAVIELMSQTLGLPKSRLCLVSGLSSTQKVMEVR